jgi:hypothetical protein
MHLAADYIHPTPLGGSCRVRIYLPDVEALQGKQDRIAKLEQDRDALLDSLVEIGAEALDALSPDERNQLYRILQLKVVLNKDAMPELSGVFGQGLDVCTLESQP